MAYDGGTPQAPGTDWRVVRASSGWKGFSNGVRDLSEHGANLLLPHAGVNAVRDPAYETQPLGNVVSVGTNILLTGPDIEQASSASSE